MKNGKKLYELFIPNTKEGVQIKTVIDGKLQHVLGLPFNTEPALMRFQRAINLLEVGTGERFLSFSLHDTRSDGRYYWIITEPMEPQPLRQARLDEKELERAEAWRREHVRACASPSGGVSYTFSEIGVGTVVRVFCTCGEKCDITDYESF